MTRLLTNLEKKPYQAYTIEHGMERISIQIPLKEARGFEAAFAEAAKNGASKDELLKVMNSFGGNLRMKHRD